MRLTQAFVRWLLCAHQPCFDWVFAVQRFRWLSMGPLPPHCDLRRCGWELVDPRDADQAGAMPQVLVRAQLADSTWLELVASAPERRRSILIVEASDSAQCARLLRLGFGDALRSGSTLAEVEARAARIAAQLDVLPRCRRVAGLTLDLILRDCTIGGRRLGLHPREFALLWRLADDPGQDLTAQQLIRDVWQMPFRPETNSLAVHLSRLRAKLRLVGFDGLIETLPGGTYRLALAPAPAPGPIRAERQAAQFALDAHVRLREEPCHHNEEPDHAHRVQAQ